MIARAQDDNNDVLAASLDLSAAFDVVNIALLVKRLSIVGLPDDLIRLINVRCLNNHLCSVFSLKIWTSHWIWQ